jgi:hypothetical protein
MTWQEQEANGRRIRGGNMRTIIRRPDAPSAEAVNDDIHNHPYLTRDADAALRERYIAEGLIVPNPGGTPDPCTLNGKPFLPLDAAGRRKALAHMQEPPQ